MHWRVGTKRNKEREANERIAHVGRSARRAVDKPLYVVMTLNLHHVTWQTSLKCKPVKQTRLRHERDGPYEVSARIDNGTVKIQCGSVGKTLMLPFVTFLTTWKKT